MTSFKVLSGLHMGALDKVLSYNLIQTLCALRKRQIYLTTVILHCSCTSRSTEDFLNIPQSRHTPEQ